MSHVAVSLHLCGLYSSFSTFRFFQTFKYVQSSSAAADDPRCSVLETIYKGQTGIMRASHADQHLSTHHDFDSMTQSEGGNFLFACRLVGSEIFAVGLGPDICARGIRKGSR